MGKAVRLGLCEDHQSSLFPLPGRSPAIDSLTTAALCDLLGDGFVATAVVRASSRRIARLPVSPLPVRTGLARAT